MELTWSGEPNAAVSMDEVTQVGQARRVAQRLATRAGFSDFDSGRVALVVTELATNVVKHARGGELLLQVIPGRHGSGIEVLAIDRGPGFDLTACLPDGFSTSGTKGIGLGAVARQAELMDVYADHRGSVVCARVYPRQNKQGDLRFGVIQTPNHGEIVCGDGWALGIKKDMWSALVVDGLGHGHAASIAAAAALQAFLDQPWSDPAEAMGALHRAMTGTRGGAVALAQWELERSTLRFAGIGNIAGSLVSPESSKGIASHPGIVGAHFRRAQPFDFGDALGKALILHSDGLQSRWRLSDYPGLYNRHPAVIAAVLHRDFNRNRDDSTVMVIALERTNV